jgi:hypothetical protein
VRPGARAIAVGPIGVRPHPGRARQIAQPVVGVAFLTGRRRPVVVLDHEGRAARAAQRGVGRAAKGQLDGLGPFAGGVSGDRYRMLRVVSPGTKVSVRVNGSPGALVGSFLSAPGSCGGAGRGQRPVGHAVRVGVIDRRLQHPVAEGNAQWDMQCEGVTYLSRTILEQGSPSSPATF